LARTAQDPFLILQGRIEAWERCARIPGCDKAIWRQDAASVDPFLGRKAA
jgi:hypothetical protein